MDVARPLEVEVIFGLVGARFVEHDRNEVALEAIIVAGDVAIVLVFSELLLVKFDLDLHILLAVTHEVALHVPEVDQVIKLIINIELCDECILQIVRVDDLLVPSYVRLGEIDPADPCLESDVRLDLARQESGG